MDLFLLKHQPPSSSVVLVPEGGGDLAVLDEEMRGGSELSESWRGEGREGRCRRRDCGRWRGEVASLGWREGRWEGHAGLGGYRGKEKEREGRGRARRRLRSGRQDREGKVEDSRAQFCPELHLPSLLPRSQHPLPPPSPTCKLRPSVPIPTT